MIEERGDLPPICLNCTQNHGLCVRHVPSVCPQLKQPSWHRHVVAGDRDSETHLEHSPPPSKAALKVMRRKERKARKAATRQTKRMVRLISGEHVPVSRSA